MSEQIKTTTIDQLPEADKLDGLYVFGYDGTKPVGKRSVKASIDLLKGNQGNQGDTPTIGGNGNWWISGVDTGKPARGEDGNVLAEDYAKILNATGEKVVYAKDGVIDLGVYLKKAEVGYGEVIAPPDKENKYDKSLITPNKSLDNNHGGEVANAVASIINYIAVSKGDTVEFNSHLTLVFYDSGKNIKKVVKAIAGAEPPARRAILVDDSEYSYIRFTILNTWVDTNSIYCYVNFDGKIARGVDTKYIFHDKKPLYDSLITAEKGSAVGNKNLLPMVESTGRVNTSGIITTPDARGTLATSEILAKNSYYLIEIKAIIKGIVSGTISGNQISIAGRTSTWFKTDDREGQILTLAVQGDFATSWDVRGKYKVYKMEESAILKGLGYAGKLPSIGSDYSSSQSATIAEPEWAMWNIYTTYYNLTLSSEYGKERFMVEYLDSNGIYFQKYATAGAQGKGSLNYENRNMKCKLVNRDGSKFVLKIGNWLPRSTYHFKVNYVDFTQAKNQATANFVTDWYRDANDPTRKTYPWNRDYVFDKNEVKLDLYDNRARGVIAGIPCLVCSHWSPRHVATMNLNAFTENFKLDEKNPLHRGYKGGFDHETKSEWEELCSDTEGDAIPPEIWQPFLDFFTWLKANSGSAAMQTFIEGDGIRYDKDDMIDYWLMAEFMYLVDNGWMNMIWITYNSVKFTPMWYDMDTCFGSTWNGTIIYTANQEFNPSGADIYFWKQLKRAFPNEIQERYKVLRASGRFSVEKIQEIYGNYIARFPYEWTEIDFHTWVNRASISAGHFASLERYLWFTKERLVFLDNKYGYTK